MGGRGSRSSIVSGGGGGGGLGAIGGGGGAGLNNVANQAPSPQNTPVVPNAVTALSQMSDQQLTALFMQSRNVDMPNHLADVSDATQKFVYAAGINAKPTVLDAAQFNQYLADNNISQSDILARSTGGASYNVNGTNIRLSANQVTDLIKYGDLTYVGGKHGGMVYGAGTYFDKNGGRPTGYASGGQTMIGVLSKDARPISLSALQTRTRGWSKTHQSFSNAVGAFSSRTASIYALAQGYNVITDGMNSYHNVIDRSALVLRKNNY